MSPIRFATRWSGALEVERKQPPVIANTTPLLTSAPATSPLIFMARSLARGLAACQRNDEADRVRHAGHARPEHEVMPFEQRAAGRRRQAHRERAERARDTERDSLLLAPRYLRDETRDHGTEHTVAKRCEHGDEGEHRERVRLAEREVADA